MANNRIDIDKIFDDLLADHFSSGQHNTFNGLIVGHFGSGKTKLAETCPGPVLYHSFDPGGATTLRDSIKSGHVIPDTRFEIEDLAHPKSYLLWEKEFKRLKRAKAFDHVGTYMLDSFTTFADSMLLAILAKEGRADQPPQLQDYNKQIHVLKHMMRDIASLPCNFLCTAHIQMDKDESSGRMYPVIMATGKLKEKIPLLFDEVYVMQTKQSSSGTKYQILTNSDGVYEARSRLANQKGSNIQKYEEPNIKNILKKAGMPYEDKPRNSNNNQNQS